MIINVTVNLPDDKTAEVASADNLGFREVIETVCEMYPDWVSLVLTIVREAGE